MNNPAYHIPALLPECIEGLNIKPDGTYVDVTFGGGGHSRGIIDCLGENDISSVWIKMKMHMPIESMILDSLSYMETSLFYRISCTSIRLTQWMVF